MVLGGFCLGLNVLGVGLFWFGVFVVVCVLLLFWFWFVWWEFDLVVGLFVGWVGFLMWLCWFVR